MPALKKDGTFSQVPLDSTSASIWIREVLVSYGVHRDDVKVLASHSMKTTTLSWMAKWGANELHRQLLGYHVPSQQQSMLIYSRDAMSGPLRALNQCIDQIRAGLFRPDCTRSGYFAPTTKPAVQTLEEPVAVVITSDSMQQEELLSVVGDATEEVVDAGMSNQGDIACRRDDKQRDQPADLSSSSSDSEVSSQDSQAALDLDETFAAEVTGIKPAPAGAPGQRIFQHKRSGMLHVRHGLDSLHLLCSRPLTKSYHRVTTVTFSWARCSLCFSRAPGTDS